MTGSRSPGGDRIERWAGDKSAALSYGAAMPRRYIALLRAVNVGGTGTLAMSDLIAICADVGFARIKTHIASGNVVFTSRESATAVRAALVRVAHMGNPVGSSCTWPTSSLPCATAIRFPTRPENSPSRSFSTSGRRLVSTYSARNEAAAKAKGVKRVCIPNRSTKSLERKREQKKRWFRNGQKWRTGCEGRISVVKRRHGLSRCRTRDLSEWIAGSASVLSPQPDQHRPRHGTSGGALTSPAHHPIL
jgi:hypothetical protein